MKPSNYWYRNEEDIPDIDNNSIYGQCLDTRAKDFKNPVVCSMCQEVVEMENTIMCNAHKNEWERMGRVRYVFVCFDCDKRRPVRP